ncbi:MAG TPA: 3-hydroxyacyl-CoA dehydrogenase family protein [Bacillota bacterium]|nr:3-hydroxyacyl-CoA dehydrogenase family protein [Bacillota bacterium]
MKNIGVIGAGVMGRGVAQSLAQSGYQVILLDISNEILEHAKEEIYNNVRFQAFFNKNKDLPTPEEVLAKISFVTDYEQIKGMDVIIENVTENWEIKKTVYQKIDTICPPHCIFLVNTSCIPITRVAALTKRPDKVIGTHFMNPVPLKTAVETIRGYHTSEETIAAVKDLLATMGKEMILVNDLPGFVSNRISHLFMNEAAFVVQDQVATPQDVDDVFKKCYGHKMGPLETADLIGLDTVVNSLDVLYENYQDPKFRCCPLLRKMVDAGLYGRKSGQGFYTYETGM